MIENATGVVLRTRPLTETSLIVQWLTAQLGRISTVAKGARRPKSPFRGKLDLFFRADFSFSRSRRSDLHTLREVSLRETNAILRHELTYLHQAAYATALIEQTTETETPLPEIYSLMNGLLQNMSRFETGQLAILAFELKLLNELGLQPNPNETRASSEGRLLMKQLIVSQWPSLCGLKVPEVQLADLRRFLHGFLIYHLERIPPGRAKALAPLSSESSE